MILAIDTATRLVSLALSSETALAAERSWQSENNHTIELAPAVERLLSEAGVRPDALTAVAVAIGPGSFTGVRIGLGFAKGLALARGLPLIGVKTLDLVMKGLPLEAAKAIAVIQAGRGRVIWAPYAVQETDWAPAHDGVVGTWDDVASAAGAGGTVTGEIDPVGERVLQQHQIRSQADPGGRAGRLAEIGRERWRRGALDSAAALTPVYAHPPASGTQP